MQISSLDPYIGRDVTVHIAEAESIASGIYIGRDDEFLIVGTADGGAMAIGVDSVFALVFAAPKSRQ